MADAETLEGLRSSVALLKRVCRARTAVAWKEWRAKQEADRAASLAKHLDLLRVDAAFLDASLTQMRGAAAQARAWAAAVARAASASASGSTSPSSPMAWASWASTRRAVKITSFTRAGPISADSLA